MTWPYITHRTLQAMLWRSVVIPGMVCCWQTDRMWTLPEWWQRGIDDMSRSASKQRAPDWNWYLYSCENVFYLGQTENCLPQVLTSCLHGLYQFVLPGFWPQHLCIYFQQRQRRIWPLEGAQDLTLKRCMVRSE